MKTRSQTRKETPKEQLEPDVLKERKQPEPPRRRAPRRDIIKEITSNEKGFHGIPGSLSLARNEEEEEKVKNFFKDNEAFNIYQKRRVIFPRIPVAVKGLDELWQCDLADLKYLMDDNDGFRYLLVVIDVFSRFVWVVPLKNKTGNTIKSAFEKIFSSTDRRPKYIQFDEGTEFKNKSLTDWLKSLNIHTYHVYTDQKAVFSERFHRTFKLMLTRYLQFHNTRKYIHVLPTLIANYNTTKHSAHGMSPDSINKENEEEVKEILNKKLNRKRFDILQQIEKSKENGSYKEFKKGDIVRLSREKGKFEKEHDNNYGLELFRISMVRKTIPKTYYLEALDGDPLFGVVYPEELVKANKPNDDTWKIEKILEYRSVEVPTTSKNAKNPTKTQREALVKWQGYQTPTWVNVNLIKNIG